tara:strand:+ start:1479 stop:1958 length:480 start_codon:yes stop_codon:yes gene_type:complete
MAKRKTKLTTKSKAKAKRKKLTSIPVIIRRLFRLASQCCRESADFKCEICGMKKGDLHNVTEKPQRVEAHHIMSRNNKDSPLKFDLRNLICLCSDHHKLSKYSAHSHGIWFADWLQTNKPEQYQWVLDHSDDTVNLKDREVLAHIEKCLRANKELNFDK